MSLQGALGLAGWRARTALEEFAEYIAVDLAYAYQSNDIGFRANTILEQARADFGDIQGISGLVVTDPRGYVHIANCFSEQFMEENDTRLHLNTVVTRINWGDDCVCATVTEKGGSEREYCGSYAIVTFSIGVLQSDIVEFVPSPPRSWLITLHRAIMIPFLRAHIQFNETFWDTNVDFIMYVDEDRPRGYYAAFIPEGAYLEGNPPIVTALLGDPHAFRVAHQDPEITRREVSEVMRNIYGDRASEAIAVSVTDFIPSPYFRGNVGRPTPGFTERSYDILAGPLGRMYFAGDGTILRHHSTAHGAFISGGETAERILQDIADRAALQLQFVNNTPRVEGNSILAEFTVSRPVERMQCKLAGLPRQNCQLTATTGAANFTLLATGSYRVVVVARNDHDDRAVLRSDSLSVN